MHRMSTFRRMRASVMERKQHVLSEWNHMSEEEQNEAWVRRVRPSKRNKARTLYCDFTYRWRYWKLLMLLQKLLIVLALCIQQAHGSPVTTAYLLGGIHASMLALTLYARPYLDHRPDFLSMGISAANIFNAVLGVLTLSRVRMAYKWLYAIYAINFGLPLLSLLTGFHLHKRRKRRRLAEGKRVGKPVDSDKMAKQRRLVERNINEYTLRFLVSWTSVVVICSCLAAELIFIGQFEKIVLTPVWAHASPSMVPPSTEACAVEAQMRTLEYIGYGSWAAFTANCCCMSRTTTSSLTNASSSPSSLSSLDAHDAPFTELWMCTNATVAGGIGSTAYKERQRRPLDSSASAEPEVRPFCGTQFLLSNGSALIGYEPAWDAALERFVVEYTHPDGTLAERVLDYW